MREAPAQPLRSGRRRGCVLTNWRRFTGSRWTGGTLWRSVLGLGDQSVAEWLTETRGCHAETAVGSPAPGDSEVGPRDGRSKRKRHTATRVSGPTDDDQTLADREQTVADVDQTAADSDQAAADSDQAASDSDQAASDLELVRSGDVGTHDTARDLRDRGSRRRSEAAQERVEAASARDAVALARDRAAAVRDEAAAARDAELETAVAHVVADSGAENAPPASETLGGGAADRVWAAEFRARAAADREQAARDREQAARDRLAAQNDREALLQRLASAETDELTGTRTRSARLADLEHEIARARRTAGLLVTAYIDAVGGRRRV